MLQASKLDRASKLQRFPWGNWVEREARSLRGENTAEHHLRLITGELNQLFGVGKCGGTLPPFTRPPLVYAAPRPRYQPIIRS